jgi:FkbM family methyltransferase
MTFAGFTRLLPEGFFLTVADVGSAGGLQARWRPARPWIKGLLFEPREGGSVRHEGSDTIYPVALGTAPGRATLNITRLANMSSTLVPNAELLSTFRKKGEDVAIVDHLELEIDTLDRICAEGDLRVDAIKVDTQGSELTILAGAEQVMADAVLLAEVELSFLERYHGQALAADVLPYMAARGFDLIELHRPKRYRAKNRSNVVSPGSNGAIRSGRVAYADGIFFIREERLKERFASMSREQAESTALKAMLSLLIYQKPDMAARVFDLSADYLAPERRYALDKWFRSLARGSPVQFLARQAGKFLGRRG